MNPIEDDAALPAVAPSVRVSAFRQVPWHWTDAVIGVVPIVVAALASLLARRLSLPPVVPLALGAFAFPWMLGYPLWVGRRRGVRLFKLPAPRTFLLEAALAPSLLIAIWLCLGLVVRAWQRLSGDTPHLLERFDQLPQAPNGPAKLAVMLLIVILGPMAEEVFFRGLLYNTFRRYLPGRLAAVLQALLFGVAHPFGSTYILATAGLGLAFAAVYEWRKTLLAPILLHVLQNLVALSVTFALAPNADSPFLGIGGEPTDDGCRVAAVQEGSAADEAGLKAGDVITAVDSQPVKDMPEVARIVRAKKVGDPLSLDVRRDGDVLSLQAVLKRRGF